MCFLQRTFFKVECEACRCTVPVCFWSVCKTFDWISETTEVFVIFECALLFERFSYEWLIQFISWKKNEKAGSFSHSNTTYRHRRNIELRGRWRIRRSRKRPYLKERNDLFHKDTRNKPMEIYIEMMTRLESQEPDEPSTIFSSLLIVVFNCLHSAVSTIPSANL